MIREPAAGRRPVAELVAEPVTELAEVVAELVTEPVEAVEAPAFGT